VCMFENMVLGRMFGPKRDEVTGKWRKLHNELNVLYFSPSIVRVLKSRKNEMGGACSAYWEGKRRVQGFGGGKRPLGRPRRRWEENIKTDLQEVGCGSTDCIELA